MADTLLAERGVAVSDMAVAKWCREGDAGAAGGA
jgi:hypothetical protein